MNKLENIKVFLKVADFGSLTKAAANLSIAKSVVSRRLKELEADLDIALFHRNTRNVKLTQDGQAYYQATLKIVDELNLIEQSFKQQSSTLSGEIKIALPESFGLMHIQPLIFEFNNLYPNVRLDIDFNDRQVDLLRESYDFAIRIANMQDSTLVCKKLSTSKVGLFASQSYIKQYGNLESYYDLINHRCLSYSLLTNPSIWEFWDANHNNIAVKIKPYIKSSSAEFKIKAAINGLGIVYLPKFLTSQAVEKGQLIELLPNNNKLELNIYGVYPQTRHLSSKVRTLLDFLTLKFATNSYW